MRTRVKTPDQGRRVGDWLEKNCGKFEEGWLVSMTKFRRPRTNAQNSKFHVLISDYCLSSGDDPKYFKKALIEAFGPRETAHLAGGLVVHVPKSDADWSVEEASAMIERLYYEAIENGVTLE